MAAEPNNECPSPVAAIAVALCVAVILLGKRHATVITPVKPGRQMNLFESFCTPPAKAPPRHVELEELRDSLLWFRGWPQAQQEWDPKARFQFYNICQMHAAHLHKVRHKLGTA